MAIFTTIQIISTISPHILATPSPICDKRKEHLQFLSQTALFQRIIWKSKKDLSLHVQNVV